MSFLLAIFVSLFSVSVFNSPLADSSTDCVPTHILVVTTYGSPRTDCFYERYEDVCDDGTVFTGLNLVCDTFREVKTITTTTYSGLFCPPVTTTQVSEEHVGSSTRRSWGGPSCPDSTGCCRITGSGWKYQYGAKYTVLKSNEVIEILCPDGVPGYQTTTVKCEFQKRDVLSWISYEPTGDCPGETCDDVELSASQTPLFIGESTSIITTCP